MAITRKFQRIVIELTPGTGAPTVTGFAVVTDDVEGSESGVNRDFLGPNVVADATALRDRIVNLAAAAGKPLTF